jgi:hypothetical protein
MKSNKLKKNELDTTKLYQLTGYGSLELIGIMFFLPEDKSVKLLFLNILKECYDAN